MPRPISARYLQLRQQLVSRIEEGYLRPGDRFYSNRALAKQFGVSYQTAHRLAADLERMGLLTRTVGSGSYVSGAARTPVKADLIFNERAMRGGCVGAHRLGRLTA
ncbi:MAG: GntR family transcriptional regulator [Puniceicoccaceae bacterium]|nr:MAG: GntR family transcriptional regulator [Puniceicoccaceae bacterium]